MPNLNRDPPKSGEYYVESYQYTRLVNDKLSRLAAHLICLRIIAFCSLHRDVPGKELDLLQFSTTEPDFIRLDELAVPVASVAMGSNAIDHQGEQFDTGSPHDGLRILEGIARAARSYLETA